MCTFAMRWIHAKYILATFISILIVIAALASFIDGTAAVVLYTMLFLFERYLVISICLIAVFHFQRFLPWV
jgi:hypothetical protein